MKKLISFLVIISMLLSMLVATVPASALEVGAGGASDKKATVEDGYVPFDENGDGEIDSGVFKVTTDFIINQERILHL